MTARNRAGALYAVATSLILLIGGSAWAQLRIATWNLTDYGGGRVADLQTAIYGEYSGRSMSPDILIAVEVTSSSAMTALRDALNTAPGSPGDWMTSTYVNGSDCVMLYRSSKIAELGPPQIVSYAGSSPNPPRHALRYRVRPQGYISNAAILCLYGSHMKAGDTADDQLRRLTEAEDIRANAALLNEEWNFLFAGDMNMAASSEDAYHELISGVPDTDGQFHDPVASPGTWRDNYTFRFLHSQAPDGAMDDRFDQILLSSNLIDGDGFDYIGDPTIPFSVSTWNDANHSYRTWGNDGTSFNTGLKITGNAMVGATIAQAIVNIATASGTLGHIPVYLDLAVPPEIGSDTALDFGPVPQGEPAEMTLSVWNDGDVALWTVAGVGLLRYSMATTAGFTAPIAPFTDLAGAPVNEHAISMGTFTTGAKSGTLTITSNAPDEPVRAVTLTGHVYARGDMNCDDAIDFNDINAFVKALVDGQAAYEAAYPTCNYWIADISNENPPHVGFEDINPFVELLLQ